MTRKLMNFASLLKLNVSKKRRGIRSGADLVKDAILDTSLVLRLTKRMILSQVNPLYDPLGWDEPIPPEHDELWRTLFNLFFDIAQIRLRRCLSVSGVKGNPILITFSDSSIMAFGSCSYIRWECNDGHFSTFIAAKTRMWPIDSNDYLSVCRGELQGAVLATRLAASIVDQTRFRFAEILHVIDPGIVLAQINMDSHNFTVFVGKRVAEIRAATHPGQ